jgi:hypothetical protein
MDSEDIDNLAKLQALEPATTQAAALALFDSLPAVSIADMLGSWRGSGLATGNSMDGMLESFGWHGKRWDGPDDAHPLVFATGVCSLITVNPLFVPIGLVARHAAFFKKPMVVSLLKSLINIVATSKPQARLRMTEFRGVVTGTMIYDSLPINDVFRSVNHDTLLGLMDLRGLTEPFFFVLRRESR